MKPLTQRTILLLLLLLPASDADAVFESALRGDYDFAAQRACDVDFASDDPAGGGILTHHLSVRGTATFDGAGNVTSFVGQFLITNVGTLPPGTGLPTGAGTELSRISGDLTSCSGSYTVNADGTFSETLNCNLTFTGGPNAGQTGTLNGIAIKGKLAMDGTVLQLGNTTATTSDVEVLNCPGCNSGAGLIFRRICGSTGTATARR